MSRSFLTGVAISLAVAGSNAQAFDLETGALYAQSSISSVSFDAHMFALGSVKYFEKIDVGTAPYGEAAFMQQAGGLGVNYMRLDPGEFEVVALGLSGEHWFDQTYISAGFEDVSVKGFGSDQVLSAEIGYAPDNTSLLAVGVIDDGVDANISARGKLIRTLPSENLVNLEASYLHSRNNPTYEVGADYYIDQSRSVGLSWNRQDGNNLFGIRGSTFVTPKLAISAALENGQNVSGFAVGGTYRF